MKARKADYIAVSQPHRDRAGRVKELVEEVLREGGINLHGVTHRLKTEESAKEKIERSPDKYGSFADLHDLLGVRVITHLETEVDAAEKVLKSAFDFDPERSVDKAKSLNDDEFGYRSVHLVVRLRDDRAALPEWRNFAGIYFEIQVRSILQHAWAEIEHDLGYKSSVAVPREIRRRFARLAGLLELADDEFVKLASDARRHATAVSAAVKGGKNVAVERDSVLALVSTPGPVRRADLAIARGSNRPLAHRASHQYATTRAEELRSVGLLTIEQINELMEIDWERVAKFASGWLLKDWVDGEENDPLSPGISLYYLYLHLRLTDEGSAFNAMPSSGPVNDLDMEIEEYFRLRADQASSFNHIHDEAFRDT